MKKLCKNASHFHALLRPILVQYRVMRLSFAVMLVLLGMHISAQTNSISYCSKDFTLTQTVDGATGIVTVMVKFVGGQPDGIMAVAGRLAFESDSPYTEYNFLDLESSMASVNGELNEEHDEDPRVTLDFLCSSTEPVGSSDTFWLKWRWMVVDGSQPEAVVYLDGIVQVDVIVGLRMGEPPFLNAEDEATASPIRLEIDASAVDMVTCTNLSGQTVKSWNARRETIDLNGLPDGVYLLTEWKNGQVLTRRKVRILK